MSATPDHAAEKLAVAAALRALERALDLFIAALSHQQGAPVSAEGANSPGEALRQICTVYSTIDYAQDDAVNASPTCLGVVGASAPVIARADAVNRAKAELRAVCSPLQNRRVRIPLKDGEGGRVVKPMPLVRVILRELGRSDLNLLAAYRKIPVLTGRVSRVTYTRALTRAVYRKTRAEIATLAAATNRLTMDDDLRRLHELPRAETHLALAKDRYTNIRANVWFHGLDARNRGRVMVAAELPLLYPMGRSKEIPEVRYPASEEGATSPSRSRTGKLEPEPYLQSLPVYRYLPAGRSPRTR
jgi:hypothetical protein